MVRRNIHLGDLANATSPGYMSGMVLRLESGGIRGAHAHAGCCAAHDRPAAATLRAAEEACAARGLRLTPQRRAVLALLVEAKRPLGAYDLIEAMRSGEGRAPAPIAIYRALDFLRENGFIHRLESLNAFIACPHPHGSGERVVFLICEACRHVDEVLAEPLSEALAALARAHAFKPERQVIELAGRCRQCQTGTES